MEDIRLKELRCIIESFNESGNLTDVALKNIIEYLDYTEIRFNKVVSDHKAVVEIKDKIIEDLKVEKLMILRDQVDETITMQNKIDELEDQLDLLKSCENCYAMDCDGCKRDISSFRGNQQDNWKGIK